MVQALTEFYRELQSTARKRAFGTVYVNIVFASLASVTVLASPIACWAHTIWAMH